MAEEYYLKHPKKQKFYLFLAVVMNLFGIGRQYWWGYKLPIGRVINFIITFNRYMTSMLGPVLFIQQFVYLYVHYKELTFNMKGTIVSLGSVTGLVFMVQISSYQKSFSKLMKDFMNKIHLCNLDDQDEFITKERIKYEKLTRFASYYMIVFLMMDWVGWCSISALNNYLNRDLIRNGTLTYETTLYYPFPFDFEHDFKAWLFVHSCNAYFIFGGCLMILVHTSAQFTFIFQIIGHIEILKHRLKTYFVESHTDAVTREKLIKIIKHHVFILNTFKGVEDAFGFYVSAYYLYNLASDSFNIYEFMLGDKQNKIVFAGMIIVYMGGLIEMSFILEEVKRQSDDISDYVYCINWEDMSQSNKKIVFLLLFRTQSILQFTGMGGFRAGIVPMISIIKTTFSFYVILKEGQ